MSSRVWITRDERPEGPLCRAVLSAGLVPVHDPVVRRVPVGDAAEEIEALTERDWLVLTSAFVLQCIAVPQQLRCNVAAVGESTARAAREHGLEPTIVNEGDGAQGLFDELLSQVNEGMICYPRSSQATVPNVPAGVSLLSPVVYETTPREFDRRITERVDCAAVTSPSAVRAIGRTSVPLASIGPATSSAIRVLGMSLWAEAAKPTFHSLALAISKRLASRD